MRKYIVGALVLAAAALGIREARSLVSFNTYLVNTPAQAYSGTTVFDTNQNGIYTMSVQAVYSSDTFRSSSFGDGTASTGSVIVTDYLSLTTATATDRITVVSTTGLLGASLTTQGAVLQNGVVWRTSDTTSHTAAILAAALAQVPGFRASSAGNVVFATATLYGASYNSFQLVSSTPTALRVSSATLTGGRDNAVLTVAGVALYQGRQWSAAKSSSDTAKSISAAINADPLLSTLVVSTWSRIGGLGVVYATSTHVGTSANFSIASSTPAALTPFAPSMRGGSNSAFAINTGTLHTPGHGLSLALPVLFSTGSGVGLAPLAPQTTYWVIPAGPDDLSLALSSANALAGIPIVFTSSSTQAAAHSFTLAPLPIAGTPGFFWESSNDGLHYNPLSVSSVTIASYSNPPATVSWDFGTYDFRYLRFNFKGPDAGAINLQVNLNGRQ